MKKETRYLITGMILSLTWVAAIIVTLTAFEFAPWWVIVAAGVLLYWFFLEIFSLTMTRNPGAVRRNYEVLRLAVDDNWKGDLLPIRSHPFANFVPKPSPILDGINEKGFRSVGPRDEFSGVRIYLAGDCTAVDSHLSSAESLGNMLENELVKERGDGVEVVNAGFDHYTSIHSLSRFIIDVQSFGIDIGLFATGINDVLSFVHTNGVPTPDYSNFYVVPTEADGITGPMPVRHPWLINTLPSLRLISSWASRDRMPERWDRHVVNLDRDYTSVENLENCYAGFHTRYIRANLQAFVALCRLHGARPIFMTIYYNPEDMRGPVRAFYAHGIDRANEEIRRVAMEDEVLLLDMAKEFPTGRGLVDNKWHFTAIGNQKRVRLITEFLKKEALPLAVGPS